DPAWEYQKAYEAILFYTPRLVLASIIAFFCGEFSNSFVLAKMKILTRGRFLWTRTIGSTLVGEFVDTLLFVVIAFSFTYSGNILLKILLFNYLFKCSVEILFTPITYAIVRFLKQSEQVDYFDYNTNFNPFRLAE
ncbi:MAG: queuosine precursor transporter, partial [Candidatus Sumerlaeia bacterium]|nr:queuosine precursor transporter [Candidatus Sumerlaeia bacterium]